MVHPTQSFSLLDPNLSLEYQGSSLCFNPNLHPNRHKFISSCGKYIYHLAIIDYLQTFNLEKWGESKIKIWLLRRPRHLISAVEPEIYRERFMKFMANEVLIESNLFSAEKERTKMENEFW